MGQETGRETGQPLGQPGSASTTGAAMAPLSILYIEDSEDVRMVVSMMLEGDQREIVSCASGEEALALVDERRFDIVMTDVSLPGISGTDVARRVLEVDPQQWVVLCSGYDLRQGLASLGVHVRALSKPFEFEDLEALLAEISQALGR